MKTDMFAPLYPTNTTNTASPQRRAKFSHRESVLRDEILDDIKQRAIRRLYTSAVDAGVYPCSKPTVRLVNEPYTFSGTYVLAEVETL